MRFPLLAAIALAGLALAGCVDEQSEPATTGDDTENLWKPGKGSHPAYGYPVTSDLPMWNETVTNLPAHWKQIEPHPLPETISSLNWRGNVPGAGSGAGIAIFGTTMVAGNFGGLGIPGTQGGENDVMVLDLQEPGAPVVTGRSTEGNAGDTDFIAYPDGRLVAITSTRGATLLVFDVTDRENPFLLSIIESPNGNHNHAVVPGTPILYNNPSDGAGGNNDIWDLSDPEAPVLVNDWNNGYGCHASSFYVNAEEGKYRGYCAGLQFTQIWDITDPVNPSVIVDIPWPGLGDESGTVGSISTLTFSHLAMTNHDGTVLIVGDETGGGVAPGCDAYVENPVTGETTTGPLGNLFFYDIQDETNPVLHGAYSPGAWEQRGSCTAHFGGVIEDTNHLVMAYYTAGVALVDFNDLDNPRAVDLWQRDDGEVPGAPCTACGVWDVWYYNGFVYTGDIDRGLDVLTIE